MIKLYFGFLFIFILNSGFSQCGFKSTFKNPPGLVFNEDQTISYLNFMEINKAEVQKEGHSRTLIVQFFFDENNKFKKIAQDFHKLLQTNLSQPLDVNIIYKFQKTKGSTFISNGTDKFSIIHLNALFYATDSLLLNDLFGSGKLSRIDTTSTKLKNFTHEFVPISKFSSSELGHLFLFRGKLTGKGFACDPNEDMNIMGILKNAYDHKYVLKCLEQEKEEKKKLHKKRNSFSLSFQKRIEALDTHVYIFKDFRKIKDLNLITNENDWKKYSPKVPCYCHPEFVNKDRSKPYLYNFKAFQKIIKEYESPTTKICSNVQWKTLITRIKSDPKNIKKFKFDFYPGYYDNHWFKPEEACGYWIDSNSMVSFSEVTSTEPMIDSTISLNRDSVRLNLLALSILNTKIKNPSHKNTSEDWTILQKRWKIDNLKYKNNQLKFIKNLDDWNRLSPNEPCYCYLNFDEKNQSNGYLYNYKAYEFLKNDPNLKEFKVAVALFSDWNTLIDKCEDDYLTLFNSQNTDEITNTIIPNGGFLENGKWNLPDEKNKISKFWAADEFDATVVGFNHTKKEGEVNFDLSNLELINRKKFSAYMIRFIKK